MKDSQLWLDNEIDGKLDDTAILIILVQNRQQTHDWTLIGSGANGLGIQECLKCCKFQHRLLYVYTFYILPVCRILTLREETWQ